MKVCYHGAGFVGFTGALAACEARFEVHSFDPDENVVYRLREGKAPSQALEEYVGADWVERSRGHWKVSTACEDADLHVLAVPTVKGSEPWMGLLMQVVSDCLARGVAVLVESTVDPPTAEWLNALAADGALVAVAPRRDWFVNPEQNVQHCNRVAGAHDWASPFGHLVRGFLETVTDKATVVRTGIREAAMVKAVENSLLDLPAVYAQELAVRFPDVDIREVLALAGTHWRIPTYFPNLAVGGYCVPLGTEYMRQGGRFGSLLLSEVRTAGYQALSAILRHRVGNVIVVFGLSYRSEVKVHTNGVADRLRRLLPADVTMLVVDPQYTDAEIEALGFTPLGSHQLWDTAIVATWYPEWCEIPWGKFGVVYAASDEIRQVYPAARVVGRAGWLS